MSSLLLKAGRLALASGSAMGGMAYYNIWQRESSLPSNSLFTFPDKKNDSSQRVVVIGGGVVGVTAAYKLALAGHSVILLESRSEAGQECSYCAAGGMQRSNPVVDRDSWLSVSKCIFPAFLFSSFDNSPLHFKFFHIAWFQTLTDPFFLRWVLTFTRTSLWPDSHQEEKQQEMLKFTKYAVEDMISMMKNRRDRMAKISGFNDRGSFSVSYDKLEEVVKSGDSGAVVHNPTSSKMSLEPYKQLVDATVIRTQEPCLRFQEQRPTSVKYELEACSASSERFAKELASRCEKNLGVTFLYNTRVHAIEVEEASGTKPKISQLKTNHGIVDVPEDAKVVVAAGSWTPHILSLMNLYAPVYPLKGYAMSLSAKQVLKESPSFKPKDLPSRIVSDKYMYTSRLGDEIRITSIGEFSGWSTAPTRSVETDFRKEAIRQFPQLQPWIEEAKTYCGHRPYVNDGILLLGAVDTHENLFVSCGPGSNGWKLAMGSGEVIERLVSGQSLEHISEALKFDASVVSPAGRVLHAPLFAKICRVSWGI